MKKILVANRGEIALRIMRSCKEMGIATVAVYSEADRSAPFVRYADEAVLIGPPPSAQSYLDMDKVLKAAQDTGAEAIHPGYGFLSENAKFARKVAEAGLIFIGPSPEAMEMMGDKLSAKEAAKKYSIPLVPGSEGAIKDPLIAESIAQKTGYPILIKASAGGGGKGMRIVNSPDELTDSIHRAMSEAESAFGDGSVFIEKFVTSPRHIEIQVLADQYGNTLHLFERECSIQRRHQKVIEEAPSSILTAGLRSEMGACAVQVAKACNYIGAGTVEFLLDENNRFYFLEMNTRLQVEHPVTECITGLDLVKEQIKIARGEPLKIRQEDLTINGHAIEVRVYAEDPSNNFLPDIGRITRYRVPQGPGVRVDDGYDEGMDIPIYYDPMLAKLIVHASNRTEAISRMIRAIEEFQITGCETTLSFCRFVLEHEAFVSGKFDTNFVKDHFTPEKLQQGNDAELSAFLSALLLAPSPHSPKVETKAVSSRWKNRRLNTN